MPVFIYDNGGLVEERPDAEWKQIGHEVHAHNLANQGNERKLVVGDSFPPGGCTFDTTLGDIRHKTLQEQIDDGDIVPADGYAIQTGAKGDVLVGPTQKLNSLGEIVEKTLQEKIDDGLVVIDTQREKVVDESIVPKTKQELLDGGVMTREDLREETIRRLRLETARYFEGNKTTNGYRLDSLAREKATLSYQHRHIADTDPVKADLLTKKLIYTDAITDEILVAVEQVQAAYSAAKDAVQAAYDNNNPAAAYEAVQLSDYIS